MNSSLALINGDSAIELARLDPESIDSIACDPPYEISYMGRSWDSSGIAFDTDFWRLAFRALKPGGYLLAFGSPRTFHRLGCAVEDAGFAIVDYIEWVHGEGWPKSHNLKGDHQGRGTMLKPSHEPILVARKPSKLTVLKTVEAHGTGAFRIDDCRIDLRDGEDLSSTGDGTAIDTRKSGFGFKRMPRVADLGRWPANVILDEHGMAAVDAQVADASRFFYVAKPRPKEKDAGLPIDVKNPLTVKPIELMRYLVRLVTPEGGLCLDPFMGSGSTGCAAALEGVDFLGIELDSDHFEIARDRIGYWRGQAGLGPVQPEAGLPGTKLAA